MLNTFCGVSKNNNRCDMCIYIYIGVWDCEPTYLSRVPFAAGIACHFSLSHWVKSKYDQPKTLGYNSQTNTPGYTSYFASGEQPVY